MANPQKTVDYILEQMSRAGKVSARKMFGGYCIYCNEKPTYKGSKPYFIFQEIIGKMMSGYQNCPLFSDGSESWCFRNQAFA